ncbi:Ca-activated chloride channel family protein [Catalinimonas alkaloidigena]|uniref:Ca-activated chloride channel family protein n=1 Tax=Catalinimonas alkaloidigena TaxID=1075417 RepID=A0A1G9GPZ1_9BACT|nr:VWA domain-containing protein [Catalinimonas alkaloidigena]SDL02585.1 Ca-activated chloride channel family protein [Catalinimonas alkaloidigena]
MRTYLIVGWLLLAPHAFAQTRQITGHVTDGDAQSAIPGVNVLEKGTANGIITDVNGHYTLSVTANATLVFSAVGYMTQEIAIQKDSVLDVQLAVDVKALNEVVVVGDAVAQRQSITGSVATVQRSRRKQPSQVAPAYDQSWAPAPVYPDDEEYELPEEAGFLHVNKQPLSTFSIDVEAASYSNVRRFLNQGQRPPQEAVRIEEMINYFTYDYPQPKNGAPFSVTTELHACPWNERHQLLQIGLQGKSIPTENLPPANLVFLIDVSGSMQSPEKLPLLKSAFLLMIEQLRPQDRVAMVVYAGAAGVVLPPTSGREKEKIRMALQQLEAGGSTAGAAGLERAYQLVQEHFTAEGNNRVVLATDGDFNVGISNNHELEKLIERKRESGIALTVLGFGTGNYKDAKMELLADKGNGNYAYIDNLKEAQKVLVQEFGGTLFTIAKDVKLQLEFNPTQVQAYRLIGYENRRLSDEDFNDDRKDAGELGAGHTVTALYELIPAGAENDPDLHAVDPLKYQPNPTPRPQPNLFLEEVMTVKLRYKAPQSRKSELLTHVVHRPDVRIKASDNFRWASAVAAFGMILRDSDYKGSASLDAVLAWAHSARGEDEEGYRVEFINLVKSSRFLAKR